jgi:hypothetical protein
MPDPVILPLATATAFGLAIGVERAWRGFRGSAPFHIAPALVGAYLVVRQPGLIALSWFLPLQILLWLVVTAIVCMWAAERTPDAAGDFRGSGGLALSWTLAFLFGVACAFQAWPLVGAAATGLVVFGLRTPRRVRTDASIPVQTIEKSGGGEAIGGDDADGHLEGVDGEPRRTPEPSVHAPFVEPFRAKPLLERPAA